MRLSEIVDKLYESIKDEPIEIGRGSRSLTVGDVKLTPSKPDASALQTLLPDELLPHALGIMSDYREFYEKLLAKRLAYLRHKKEESSAGRIMFGDPRLPVEDVVFLFNAEGKKSYLYNEKTKFFAAFTPADIRQELSHHYGSGQELKAFINTRRSRVKVAYAPYLRETLVQEGDELVLNTYKPAAWEELEPTGPLNPILERFFVHLLPEEACRKSVLHWMSNVLFLHFNPIPIMVLLGHGGIGKNTLVEKILLPLVGLHNFHKAASREERFNSSVKNCVLHFSDEGEVAGIVKRNLKNFHEGHVAIELKGVDVADPEQIHARFVVATNNEFDLDFNEQDRKFSVPELTDVKLEDAFSREEIDWLLGLGEDLQEQANLAHYLKTHFKHQKPAPAWQKTLFKHICNVSRPEWFRQFIYMCQTNAEFSLKAYRKHSGSGRPVSLEKLLAEILKYEHLSKSKLATVKLDGSYADFTSHVFKE